MSDKGLPATQHPETGRSWRRDLTAFYLLAVAIPLLLVGVGVFAPGLFGLEAIGDMWPLLDQTMVEEEIESRGSALWPFVRVALANPTFWVINLYAAAPTLAALILVFSARRGAGVVELAGRFRPWRAGVAASEGLRWWGVMVVVLVAMKLLEFLLFRAAGFDQAFAWGVNPFSLTFLGFFLAAMFFDQGGLLEETGWRGYALPLMQRNMVPGTGGRTPLGVAVILGVLWAAWHIPREVANEYDSVLMFLSGQLSFFVVSVFLTILISFFFNKTGGSTLMAVAVHGLSNDSMGLSGKQDVPGGFLFDLVHAVPYVSAGVVLILLAGRNLGYRGD